MASSLAQQLLKSRTPAPQKHKSSFIFDPKHAADYDLDTIFSIAVNGLAELRQIDERFALFEKTLFSDTIKDLDRVLQTKEENQKLDQSIDAFLYQLSPYFLLKPAGKTLEWLIRRFRINEMNVDAVIRCILPYHETKSFVTMVSILRIKNGSQWEFLRPVKKSNLPLDRTLFIQCLTKDRALLDFICTFLAEAVSRRTTYKTLFSFYAYAMVGFISAVPRITDDITTAIMPSILDGIKSFSHPEYQIASYMALSQLSSRAQISKEALVEILGIVAQYHHPQQYTTHMLLCFVYIAQTQESFDEFPKNAFDYIVKVPNLDLLLMEITRKYNAERFLETFLSQLLKHSILHTNYAKLLKTMLQSEGLPVPIIRSLSSSILDQYIEAQHTGMPTDQAHKSQLRDILCTLQQRFPADLDAALENKVKILGQEGSKNAKNLLKDLYGFVQETFYGTRHDLILEVGTTLYLSLNHAEANVRLIGLRKLIEILKEPESEIGNETDFIRETLVSRLQDPHEPIVLYLLSVPTHLSRFVPSSILLSTLKSVLDNPATSRAIIRKVLAFLMGPFLDFKDAFSTRRQILAIVLSNVLVNKETRKTAHQVLKALASSPLKHESLVNRLFELVDLVEEKEGDKKQAVANDIVKANTEIVKLLAENVINSQDFDGDVDLWINALASQKETYRVLSLLVLSCAINRLSGVRQLSTISRFFPSLLANIGSHQKSLTNAAIPMVTEIHHGLPPDTLLFDLATFKLSPALEAMVELFVLMNVIACMKPPPSKITWLSSEKASEDIEIYKDVLNQLYRQFTSGADISCYESAVRGLFNIHLKDGPIEFLCALWTDNAATSSPLMQVRSLQIANAYFAAYDHDQVTQKIDFQLVVPSLLIVLMHPNKIVRNSAMICLQSIAKVYRKATLDVPVIDGKKTKTINVDIFKYEVFYGNTSDQLQYLPTETAAAFVNRIVETKDEFLTDHQYVYRFLADTLNKNTLNENKYIASQRESLLSFLLSHILAFRKPVAQTKFLQLLSEVHSATKLKMLLPLLESTFSHDASINKDENTAVSTSNALLDDHIAELDSLLIKCVTPDTCSLFGPKNSIYLRIFVTFLKSKSARSDALTNGQNEGMRTHSICKLALTQVTERFFNGLSVAKQSEIFFELVELATNGTQDIVKIVKEVLRNVRINAALVLQELSIIQEALAQENEQVAKKARKDNEHNRDSLQALDRLVTILELLEFKSVENDAALVSPLFEMLAIMINSELHDTLVSVEYINQLLLSSLTSIIRSINEKGFKIDESILRVDLVVQCIRITGNPQTHNQSLLLMATIASLYPERVLHNIMPVFTFMGANVLRQDDNYSFQVIQQTLEKIIPPLVASHRDANESLTRFTLQVKPIMKVFVDALFHIPKHRRLRLFTVLVQALGEDEFLYAIITLILEKYTEKFQKGHINEAGSLSTFCLMVASQFSPKTQMTSLIALMESLLVLPNEKSDEDSVDDIIPEPTSLFDLNGHTNKQLRQFKLASLNLASNLLSNKGFLSKLLAMSLLDAKCEIEMQDYYLKMAEILLKLVGYFGSYQASYATRPDANPAIVKFWRGVLKLTYDILDKVNVLLPLPSFINIIASLLKHDDATIRRKAMLLFNDKIISIEGKLAAEDETQVVSMVKNLSIIIGDKDTADVNNETAVNKQTALLCLSTLVRGFANSNIAPFAEVVSSVIGNGALQHPNPQVKASSLVCLTFLCQEIGPRVVPNMPKFMPVVLDIMHSTLQNDQSSSSTNILLQLSSISALDVIVRTLPHFVSPYITKILEAAMHPSVTSYEGSDVQKSQVLDKSKSLLSGLAVKVQPRLLLPPLFTYFDTAVSQGKGTLLALYDVIGEAVHSMPRAVVTNHYKELFKFFLLAFDFRRLYFTKFSAQDIDETEQHIISAFLELVMKLNETLFKPLFLKTLDWATIELTVTGSTVTNRDINQRLLFFYKLMDSLLERLKSIIAPYYSYVLDNCIEQFNSYKNGVEEPDTLWTYIVRSLHKSLLYDSDNIWTAEKFDKILHPLLNQLLITSGNTNAYMERVRADLVPCIGQLAVTVSNDALWKPLNYQVLMKSREDTVEIRLAALWCLEEFYSRLGEEWLLFLAESISFLAELLEDDDPRVEKLTKEVCAHIETYLGESLDKYFN